MDTNIALLKSDVWEYINAALSNGVGLTVACEGMNIDIKAMSTFLAAKPGTLDVLNGQCVAGFKSIMTMINNSAAELKLSGWKSGHVALREFVTSVNLWEQHCTRDQVTPQIISEAFYTYRTVPEVATVCGMLKTDFWRYVLADYNLKAYLIQAKFITG